MADTLLVGVSQESLERDPVRLDTVGPVLAAEERCREARSLGGPGNREAGGGSLEDARDAAALGGLEGCEQVHGDPRMRLQHASLDRDAMHDREDPGLAPVS